ncbi:PAS domain-containing protein [Nisaea sediminum]|uniref:PAS domain-containing protein n=1 Tax=Nisaea sediminum TaxID=2775867 RepID=UPI00186880B0|nr:PAS domain-containing protein [Nisaea sediminum]
MHDIIEQAISYWESLHDGPGAPLRTSFDPVDIPRLLPHILFFDVLDEGRDFRFRVIGERVRSVFFGNYTGRTLLSLDHVEPDGPLVRMFRKAVVSREPVREPVEYVGPNSEIVKHDEVVLPLGNAAGTVTHLAVLVVLADRPSRTRRR